MQKFKNVIEKLYYQTWRISKVSTKLAILWQHILNGINFRLKRSGVKIWVTFFLTFNTTILPFCIRYTSFGLYRSHPSNLHGFFNLQSKMRRNAIIYFKVTSISVCVYMLHFFVNEDTSRISHFSLE